MNLSLSACITGVIFLFMFCRAFKLNCLWNVLIPVVGMWRREREEANTECSERKKRRGVQERNTERKIRLHNLSELKIGLMT